MDIECTETRLVLEPEDFDRCHLTASFLAHRKSSGKIARLENVKMESLLPSMVAKMSGSLS